MLRRVRKQIHVAVLESESEEALNRALSQIKSFEGVNFMAYKLDDSYLRVIFAALKEAVTSSQQ